MHQDSETASKPSFFRGHQWGCLSLLVGAAHKYFAAPLWAEIHRESLPESHRLLQSAIRNLQSHRLPPSPRPRVSASAM